MKFSAQKPGHTSLFLLAALVSLSCVPMAHADRNRDRGRDDHGRVERQDSHDFRPYRSQHWVLDSRFHHNHYYPARGYAVPALPPGHLDIGIRGGHLYFSAGVWFRPEGRRYVVVLPPLGVAIPMLPPDYTTLWLGNSPYYYANGVYYTSVPSGGYVVTAPPVESAIAMQPPPPPPPSSTVPLPPAAEDGLIVYPKNGQSAAQVESDRAECTRWAVNQTGYDPARSPPSDPRRSEFQRAAAACLEAHGYTAR